MESDEKWKVLLPFKIPFWIHTCPSKLVMTLVVGNKMPYFTVLWLIMLHIKELCTGICFTRVSETVSSQCALLYFSLLFSEAYNRTDIYFGFIIS